MRQPLTIAVAQPSCVPCDVAANAVAHAEVVRRAPSMRSDQTILVNLSGRGDKDVETIRSRDVSTDRG
jgi:tryptophan synthase beta subunit